MVTLSMRPRRIFESVGLIGVAELCRFLLSELSSNKCLANGIDKSALRRQLLHLRANESHIRKDISAAAMNFDLGP